MGMGGSGDHTLEVETLRSEPRSSSGVVGAPLEDDEEDGGWKSPLLRLLKAGSTGLLLREMDRKKRLEDFAVVCVCSVVVEAAEEEAASDLSRLEEKTAAIRRIGGTWKRGGAKENRWQESSSELRVHRRCERRKKVWWKAGSSRRGVWRKENRRKGPGNGERRKGERGRGGSKDRAEIKVSKAERTEAEP